MACRWLSSIKPHNPACPGNWWRAGDPEIGPVPRMKNCARIRSGAALQTSHGKRFLIYAVFSGATPSAMARVFQAYRCDYAMLLDMNALEHTYCALYRRSGTQLSIEHIIKGMSEVDKSAPSGQPLPRFLAYPDNRDFFYVMRRAGGQAMRTLRLIALGFAVYCGLIAVGSNSLQQLNEILFRQLQSVHKLSDAQMSAIRGIFAKSGYMGQGNPAVARHPVTPEDCEAKLKKLSISYENPRFEKICGAKYMAPLYDPATQKPEDAKACIDQFEFPDIPCAYPVVWVKAREAAEICSAMGKRLCDAHEWEGACAGSLQPPDYRWDLAKGLSPNAAIERMRSAHNRADNADQELELWPGVSERHLRHFQPEDARLQWRKLDRVRLQHVSRWRFSRLPQPAAGLRSERQRSRTHESAAESGADVEPGQPGVRLHGDEGELVYLRHLPGARGLVPLARALLARQPRDGRAQPRELSFELSML